MIAYIGSTINMMVNFNLAAVAKNVTVRILTPTSVLVFWNVSEDTESLAQWRVYYRPSENGTGNSEELSVNVTSRNTSVEINGLEEGVEYVFEVAAVTMVDGELVFGRRVMASIEEGSKGLKLHQE